jgi:hypothetical protein
MKIQQDQVLEAELQEDNLVIKISNLLNQHFSKNQFVLIKLFKQQISVKNQSDPKYNYLNILQDLNNIISPNDQEKLKSMIKS